MNIVARWAAATALLWLAGCASAPEPEPEPQPQRYRGVVLQWFEGQSFRADGESETWAYGMSDEAMQQLGAAYPDAYEPGPGHATIAVDVEGVLRPVDPAMHRYGCVGGCYNHYLWISRVYEARVLRTACQPITARVYFDSNEAGLDDRAQQAIEDVVGQVRSHACNVSRVSVIGHADTVGSPASNVALSEARARAVSDVIVALGTDRALVTTEGAGEARPLRITADNVAEPANRVVEITFEAPTAEER